MENMKLIFLDVDGVLNCLGTIYRTFTSNRSTLGIEKSHAIKLYKVLKREPYARLVLSSSWTMEAFKKELKVIVDEDIYIYIINRFVDCYNGITFKYICKTLDYTEQSSIITDALNTIPEENVFNGYYLSKRGDQIWLTLMYLKHLYSKQNIQITSFVILDDEITDIVDYKNNKFSRDVVVEVNEDDGLTHKDLVRMLKILNT